MGWSLKLHRHHAPSTDIKTWKCSFCSDNMQLWFPPARLVHDVSLVMFYKGSCVSVDDGLESSDWKIQEHKKPFEYMFSSSVLL